MPVDQTDQEAPAQAAPKRPMGRRRRRLRQTIMILAALNLIGAAVGIIIWLNTRPDLYRPGEEMDEISRNLERDLPAGAPRGVFVDVTEESGLADFRSFAGPRSSQLPEDMGAGAAWGDYDNDGDDDLFLVSAGGSVNAAPQDWAPCALYQNNGDGTFARDENFPALRVLGMAAAWGDADGDGWLDLIVTGYNHLSLYHNDAGTLRLDERFKNRDGFWAGASWGDFDNDRDLDLYICGYVQYVVDDDAQSRTSSQFGTAVPYTLNPSSYEPQPNLLFENRGDSTFEESAEARGVSNPEGRSLGAVWHDFDQDGRLDLYVANDVSDNVLYLNTVNGFMDVSHGAYVADYRGAMGLAVGDYDRDGDDDIFVTHWIGQENALYDSLRAQLLAQPEAAQPEATQEGLPPTLRFMDNGAMSGLGQPALQRIGWGAEFGDFDADGWLDLIVANGSTFETAEPPRRLKPQQTFFFWNQEGHYFHDLAPQIESLGDPWVGRGLALSDYDADGDLDALIVRLGEAPQLLRNDMQTGRWIQLRLRSRTSTSEHHGFGDGATIIARAGDVVHRRTIFSTSYLSQSTRLVHIGLGDAERVNELEVRWLGGGVQMFHDLEADSVWELREGEPAPVHIGGAVGGSAATEPLSEADRVRRFWAAHRAGMNALKVENDVSAAIGHFREALALDPEHGDARYYLGNCLAATNDLDGAMREFTELVRFNPRSRRGLERLGILTVARAASDDDLRTGLGFLERALAINSEETGVLLAMGEVEIMLGEYEAAAERFEWVSRTNPRAVSALFLLGYIAWIDGDVETAGAMLERARAARGEEWKPEGTTAEGDVAVQMFTDTTPLASYWRTWDGSPEPARAYAAINDFLKRE